MDNLDILSNDNLSKNWKNSLASQPHRLVYELLNGYVVHLETIGDVSNPYSVAVLMGQNDHSVSQLNQTQRKLKDVHFHSANFRVKEVANH